MFDQRSFSNCNVDVAGTGFAVLDRIYSGGDLSEEALGGSCGNVLVSLAMLRRHVAPVLAIGDDCTGKRIVNEFSEAGATIRYIFCRANVQSPILAQSLDETSGRHEFSFTCPETFAELPRYEPISETELSAALPMLNHCQVFYADRLSESIVEAMRVAQNSGALVFFEPSQFEETELFSEAVRLATILKYSEERADQKFIERSANCIRIVTFGARGLEIRDPKRTFWCEAVRAPAVVDTCGAGDMVSVGLIDWMLSNSFVRGSLSAKNLLNGVLAGQRLAAENCAFAGARGLFKKMGVDYVRGILHQAQRLH